VLNLSVRVDGLKELRKALKDVGELDDVKEFRDGLKAAANIVAQDARQRATPFSRRAAATIRATAGGNRVFIVGGKARLPWYGWADFGSRRPRSGQPRRVGPWANSGQGPPGGRWIYPSLEANERQVVEAVTAAIDDVLRKFDL
jgi:hypothetical protein